MKHLLLLVITIGLGSAVQLSAQTVFSCQNKYDAKVKVFVVSNVYDADLVVYKCDSRYDAEGNKGLWHFENNQYDAKQLIYFCDNKSDADLVIAFTTNQSNAEWRNRNKMYLME